MSDEQRNEAILVFRDRPTGHLHTIRLPHYDTRKSAAEMMTLMQQIADQHVIGRDGADYFALPQHVNVYYTQQMKLQ